jgi:hypothetical protein
MRGRAVDPCLFVDEEELLLDVEDDVEIHEAVEDRVGDPEALCGEHRGVQDLGGGREGGR